jgi:hypothetical protein
MGVKDSRINSMKYASRTAVALLSFLVGTGTSLVWSRLSYPLSFEDNRIPAVDVTGKVSFSFLECAGKRAVFLLENRTDYPIFARVHRKAFWKEFKDANLEYGVYLIQYRANEGAEFKDAGPMFDGIEPFRTIMPHESVRYGVDLWKGPGEYEVSVPYMENAEVARRLDEDFPSIIKQELDRVRASWRRASSDVVTRTCQ